MGWAFTDHNGIMWLWDPQRGRVFCIESQIERHIEQERPIEDGYSAYTLVEALEIVKDAV
jgi:hypothetical protein